MVAPVLLVFALLRSCVVALPTEVSSRAYRISPPGGFNRVLFQDDFSTYEPGEQPSSSKWTYDIGTAYPGGPARWGTNEVETYTKSTSNIVITSARTLQITPINTNGKWTSARIETTAANDVSCPAGGKLRIEASLKMGANSADRQLGIWPAFWSLGSAFRGKYNNWPSVGEVDVLESINGASLAWQTVHCGSPSGGPCHETSGISFQAPFTRGVFHTVALDIDRSNGGDWRGEKLTWLVDGKATFTLTGATVGDQDAWNNVARTPKFLLLNVAVGGGFPDAVAGTTTPTSQTLGGQASGLEVKYVAVFST